ncbi:hypothetical protein ACEZHJ_00505 [Arhodomonas sp. KWT2]|uniref:hypothetical protein n=2 Tax=unclassified Arhodomonas TaxID=2621637 RepID=UPI0035C11F3A
MGVAYLTVAVLLAATAAAAHRHPGVEHRAVWRLGLHQLRPLLVRLPVAIVAASFVAELIPPEWFARVLGSSSGLPGVLLASVLGGALPGGPSVSFPLVLVLAHAGVGVPQMIAMLTAWSVLALHRVLTFELPMMGWAFVWRRWLVSVMLAPLAGGLAMLVTG